MPRTVTDPLAQSGVKTVSYDNWGPQDLSSPAKRQLPEVPVERGMVLEDVQSGWVGAVTRVEKSGGMHIVVLGGPAGKDQVVPARLRIPAGGPSRQAPAARATPGRRKGAAHSRQDRLGLRPSRRPAGPGRQGQPDLGGRQARRRTRGKGVGRRSPGGGHRRRTLARRGRSQVGHCRVLPRPGPPARDPGGPPWSRIRRSRGLLPTP